MKNEGDIATHKIEEDFRSKELSRSSSDLSDRGKTAHKKVYI